MEQIVTDYNNIYGAYNFFNEILFQSRLTPVLITLNRRNKAYGYYWAEKFGKRGEEKTKIAEIALNPDHFVGRSDEDILSTLVHEMTHHEHALFGTPPKKAYHNKAWGILMKAVGLHPSSTGQPGGKETGRNMTHYLVEGGPYKAAFTELAMQGFKLDWESLVQLEDKKVAKSKVKATCNSCGQNAWGKPGAKLICGVCYEKTEEIVPMLSEEGEEAEED